MTININKFVIISNYAVAFVTIIYIVIIGSIGSRESEIVTIM